MRRFLTYNKSLLIALTFCLGAIHKSFGSTLLSSDTADIDIISVDAFNMPTEVSIAYSTDLGQAESSSSTDSAWIQWSMSGTGAAYYTGSPPSNLSVGSSTLFNIVLTRTGDPANGDYIVDLDVILRYNNDGTEFILDHVIYTLTVHVGGASTEKSTAAGSISNGSISAGSVTDDVDGAGAIPPTTPTFTLAQNGGGTLAFGDDIDLTVTLTSSDHTIWVDPSDPIIVSEDTDFVNGLNYEWPSTALTSSTEVETGTTTSVDITLKSLPVRVFDWGTVYVQLTVHYRTISTRRRVLRRRLQQEEDDGSSHTKDNIIEDGGKQQQSTDRIFAKITFHSDDSGGMAVVSSLVPVSSTTAMAAGALFMI